MRLKRLPLFAALIILTALFCSSALAQSPDVDKVFGLRFGQTVPDQMICVRGECLTESAYLKNVRSSVLSTYKKPCDKTLLGPVEITTPRYDFYQGDLIRVLFHIDCETEKAEANIAALVTELKHQLALSYEMPYNSNTGTVRGSILWNDKGLKATVLQFKDSQGWQQPVVKIYDFNQMEQVRTSLNPRYVAKAWPPSR